MTLASHTESVGRAAAWAIPPVLLSAALMLATRHWVPAIWRGVELGPLAVVIGVHLVAVGLLWRRSLRDATGRLAWQLITVAVVVLGLRGSLTLIAIALPATLTTRLEVILSPILYATAYIAFVGLIRPPTPNRWRGVLVDAAVVVLGITSLARAAVGLSFWGGAAESLTGQGLGLTASCARPLSDLLLLTAIGANAAASRRRGADIALLGLGVGLLQGADFMVLTELTVAARHLELIEQLLLVAAPAVMAAGALTTAQNGPVVILGGRTFGDLHRSGSAPGLPVQAYGRSGGLTALRVNVREGSNDWAPLIVPGLGVLMCLVVLALAQQLALSPVDRVMAVIGLMAGLARGVQMVKPDRPPEDGHQQARIDDLTGLANRRAMYEQVESVLRDSGPRHPICFLILDLDRFKEVNDALGHAAGDVLLAHVGRRLGRLVRPGDLAARLGGDEFAMLMPGASQEEAEQMARHVVETLGKPFRIGATTLHTAASVGIVASPPATRDRSELVRCADVAMYQAKRGGLGISTYSRSADHPDRLRTVEELREALRGSGEGDSGEIVVHFQPQVLLTTGEVCGAEALVRWIHPQRGTIYPGDFLPLAKASGLMDLVTEVVCDLAIGACARWWNTGLRIPVSINLPGGAVHDLALVERINVTLAKHGLPAQAITVEITEDTLMNDPPMARKVLQQLRDLGASVAIDDYGTGYSSLAYLRNLPVDELKLDKAFLNEIFDEPRAQAIVHHVIDLAHALGMRLVAEGIDDPAIAGLLAEYGCDIGQGYLFARSMPWDQWVIWAQTEGSRMREILADTNPEPVGRRSARRSAGVPVPRSEPAPVSQTQVEYPR